MAWRKEFTSHNILQVTVQTDAPWGKSSETMVEFRDAAGTQMAVHSSGHDKDWVSDTERRVIRLVFTGDSESEHVVQSLRWAANVLEREMRANKARRAGKTPGDLLDTLADVADGAESVPDEDLDEPPVG